MAGDNKIRVKAHVEGEEEGVVVGHYLQRRRQGDIFNIPERLFSKTWMKKVGGADLDEEEDDDAPIAPKPGSVDALKAECDEKGIEYPAKATKKDLLKLLADAEDDSPGGDDGLL